MKDSAKGKIAELYVANYFMEKGFYVGIATTTQQKNMRIELFEIDISSCKAHYKVYNKRIK